METDSRHYRANWVDIPGSARTYTATIAVIGGILDCTE